MDDGLSAAGGDFETLIGREWLVSNGVGGYASSTVLGLNSRKYHGLLVAAMMPPVRRLVLLSRVEESVIWPGGRANLGCAEYPGTIYPRGDQHLRAFDHQPHPRWAYQADGCTLEKQLRLLRGQNAVVLTYTLLAAEKPAVLELRPLLALRSIHELGFQWNGKLTAQSRGNNQFHVPATSRSPEVFFAFSGQFQDSSCWYLNTIYRREQQRGYSGLEDLWNPGLIRLNLLPGAAVHMVCSTEPIDLQRAVQAANDQTAASMAVPITTTGSPDTAFSTLRRAAELFPISAPRRDPDHEAAPVVAGYPWFPSSGRASLIGFAGLYLVTGRFTEGRDVLVGLAARLKNGLIPTTFSEESNEPEYSGADVSLWFAQAVCDYLRYTGDEATVRDRLFNPLLRIIDCYQHGTDLGISTDHDGLLLSHSPGRPTTWMNGKVGDWVITPRVGRAVEINALWFNALRIAVDLATRFQQIDQAEQLSLLARSVFESFNRRFWNESAGGCFDVVSDHGPDPSVRPNQIFAVSLAFPVLWPERHHRVVELVRRELLTPFGLRSLSPRDPGYVGRYGGDVVSRERAYHNGSVFPWLLGPFVTAMLRGNQHNDAAREEARQVFQPTLDRLSGEGIGLISELCDGDAPHLPGGATACALASGQLLRAYAEDVLGVGPGAARPFHTSMNAQVNNPV